MKLTRNNIFETNSSSTHSLVFSNTLDPEGYIPKSSNIVIDFIRTDDLLHICSLKEKVSYLVAHIIRNYKYDVVSYEDLIEQVKEDWDFKRIERYVKEHYNKDIVFPVKYDGDLEEIVEVNHQLLNSNFDDLLQDIVSDYHDLLDDILSPSSYIEIGRD